VAKELLPWVEDNEWFFDTELLLLVEERGYCISEVPVDWTEDLDSQVDIASTALEDVRGLLRVRQERAHRRLFKAQVPRSPRHRASCPLLAARSQGDRGRRGSQGGRARENGA